MNPIKKLFFCGKTTEHGTMLKKKNVEGGFADSGDYDYFSMTSPEKNGDAYLYSAWVDFVIKKGGDDVTAGPLYALFKRPNPGLSRYDLWKETAAWWHLEGEACDHRSLGWFGPDYAGGLPKESYVLNPRKLHHEGVERGLESTVKHTSRRRDIAEINVGLKAINDVLKERGDVWYRPKNMIPTVTGE
jgi:hypothetical protein